MSYGFLKSCFAAGLAVLALSSCSSWVYDDLRECQPDYAVRLMFDHNITSTDRTEEVEAAEIYAFDADGNLATIVIADEQTLKEKNYILPISLDYSKPYEIVVWAGLVENSPFKLDGTRAIASKEDLTCRLTAERDEAGNAFTKCEFPDLFHAYSVNKFTTEDGYEEQTIKLVKNTNRLDVVLRNEDGSEIRDGQFTVKVTDNNGVMAHDNSIISDEVIHYHPVTVTSGQFDVTDGNGNITGSAHGAKANVHLARLMKGADARIIVADAGGKEIFNLPLIDLVLQTKGRASRAPEMSDQEFLDRQNEYIAEITMPSDGLYLHLSININGWEVVVQNFEW